MLSNHRPLQYRRYGQSTRYSFRHMFPKTAKKCLYTNNLFQRTNDLPQGRWIQYKLDSMWSIFSEVTESSVMVSSFDPKFS